MSENLPPEDPTSFEKPISGQGTSLSKLRVPEREQSEEALTTDQKMDEKLKRSPSGRLLLENPQPLYILLGLSVKETFVSLFKSAVWSTKQFLSYIKFHPNHAGAVALLFALIALLFITGQRLHDTLALSRISDDAVEQIALASRFQRDFNPASVSRSGTRALLNVGAPDWVQHESIKAILTEARKADLSLHHQAALLATVDIESGFNPMARAVTTSACGLFQFVKRTGEAYNLSPKVCMNPVSYTHLTLPTICSV